MSLVALRCASMTAAWTTAALRGHVGVEQTLDVLSASELLRPVHEAGAPGPESMVHAIARWRRLGITGWWYSPVEPGEVVGVPAEVLRPAVETGAVLVSVDGACRALVPDQVLHEVDVGDHGRPPVESVSEAERHLLSVMSDATTTMTDLDVAPWSMVDARRLDHPTDPLPPGAAGRTERLADRSLRVLALIDVAVEDQGGSRTSHESARRSQVLRDVRRAARHAHAVAWNAAVTESSRPR